MNILGADDYLFKPFSFKEVEAILAKRVIFICQALCYTTI